MIRQILKIEKTVCKTKAIPSLALTLSQPNNSRQWNENISKKWGNAHARDAKRDYKKHPADSNSSAPRNTHSSIVFDIIHLPFL